MNGDADVGIRVDTGRAARTGDPEVVFGPGKTPQQVRDAVADLWAGGVRPVLVTRADDEQVAAVTAAHVDAVHHEDCGMLVLGAREPTGRQGQVVVVTAGTADLRVARECTVALAALGERPDLFGDVGVAGLHRVLAIRDQLEQADVVVVVAGMEAALAPVVTGLISRPVVAVPTSVGYGAALGGMTALHGLLTACTPGMVVLNVDNGLGAAVAVRRILSVGR